MNMIWQAELKKIADDHNVTIAEVERQWRVRKMREAQQIQTEKPVIPVNRRFVRMSLSLAQPFRGAGRLMLLSQKPVNVRES